MHLCVWLLWSRLRHHALLYRTVCEWWYLCGQWQLLLMHLCTRILGSDLLDEYALGFID